jgi:hypothetical protein
MADDHGVATLDSGLDLPAHEETYSAFVALVQTVGLHVLCVVLLLVLWGIEGHGIVALIGFVLACAAAAIGGLTGLGWKMVAPVFVLIGLACILF